jgi:hypothetical protein
MLRIKSPPNCVCRFFDFIRILSSKLEDSLKSKNPQLSLWTFYSFVTPAGFKPATLRAEI